MFNRIIKRVFDLIFALILLIIISPIFLILMIIITVDVGSPFFKQQRIGKGDKTFKLFKFKSMKDKNENKGLLSNAERVTKFGRFIRNSSLDELPSLLNIIKGDMSVVGPRPLLVEYLPFYKEKHRIRHKIRPGLTGLAQINGRNNTTWEERLNFDAQYVQKGNFIFDLKIIFSTFFKVVKKDGVESTEDLSIIRLDQDKTYIN